MNYHLLRRYRNPVRSHHLPSGDNYAALIFNWEDGRIVSVQNILLVYNLSNSISGNQYKAVNILFHCAMFYKLVPLNLMVFGVTFHERSTKLCGSFQPNPEPELTVDMDCYRVY